jgi:DNA-binding response OmpR family regulator
MRPIAILLAEDEPVIALDILALLRSEGFRVIWTTESEKAFALLERFHPDLTILNFKQQKFPDGMALARRLTGQQLLKVLFITGAYQQEIAASPDFDPRYEILYKPFTRVQLLNCLRKMALRAP